MRKFLSLILLVTAATAFPARPFGPFFGRSGAGFVPVTNRKLTGGGTETVPPGSSQLTAEGWAGGAGGKVGAVGAASRGGSSGSYGKRVFTITSADWGKGITWLVGNGGAGCASSTSCTGSNGQNTTIGSVVLNGVTLNMVMNKGLNSGSAPSAGTGGTTNTAGNASVGTTGGVPVTGDDSDVGGAGGDGAERGFEDPPAASLSGENGMVKFKWE